jgi:hypothetical protein
MKHWKLFSVALALGTVAGILVPLQSARAAGPPWNMYNWMQPPTDTPTHNACLTQLWHGSFDAPGRALDWKANCGTSGSETVYYRSRDASPDDLAGDFSLARGEPAQGSNISCGTGSLRYGWVAIRSTWDNVVKGKVTFQHFVVSSTTTFAINTRGAGSFSNAYFNNRAVGSTVSDSGAGKTCWNGWHVHENNGNTSLWDAWNTSYYNSSSDLCDCHRVDISGTWTRRLHWKDQLFV